VSDKVSYRNLIVVLGDQLNINAAAFDEFDPLHDAVWMAEVEEESTHVWSSQSRIAMFLSAMRHFAESIQAQKWKLIYQKLDDVSSLPSLAECLTKTLQACRPQKIIMTAPGDWRVLRAIQGVARQESIQLEIQPDRHFYCSVREFKQHMTGRKSLRLEYFYREMRRRHGVLMNDEEPLAGRWNFDSENRRALSASTVAGIPTPSQFEPDEITREVLRLVASRFATHPGSIKNFAWPVTREQALDALRKFIDERLANFGPYQDAMWPDKVWLFHSHLSASLNLKLLDPREVVGAAEQAYRCGKASLASVEGFIRQILGWREYVRGIYWTQMPDYLDRNELEACLPLPTFYWTGETEMTCLRDALKQTLNYGYAHHIQRLMITSLYTLLLGIDPRAVHAWYLSVYVDAVEWAELPNTLGMSQFADGGLMASKPYIASGQYINRMSPYCKTCPYDPKRRTGDNACPMTVLYWDFLLRHESKLSQNQRMIMQLRNVKRLSETERVDIRAAAESIRRRLTPMTQ